MATCGNKTGQCLDTVSETMLNPGTNNEIMGVPEEACVPIAGVAEGTDCGDPIPARHMGSHLLHAESKCGTRPANCHTCPAGCELVKDTQMSDGGFVYLQVADDLGPEKLFSPAEIVNEEHLLRNVNADSAISWGDGEYAGSGHCGGEEITCVDNSSSATGQCPSIGRHPGTFNRTNKSPEVIYTGLGTDYGDAHSMCLKEGVAINTFDRAPGTAFQDPPDGPGTARRGGVEPDNFNTQGHCEDAGGDWIEVTPKMSCEYRCRELGDFCQAYSVLMPHGRGKNCLLYGAHQEKDEEYIGIFGKVCGIKRGMFEGVDPTIKLVATKIMMQNCKYPLGRNVGDGAGICMSNDTGRIISASENPDAAGETMQLACESNNTHTWFPSRDQRKSNGQNHTEGEIGWDFEEYNNFPGGPYGYPPIWSPDGISPPGPEEQTGPFQIGDCGRQLDQDENVWEPCVQFGPDGDASTDSIYWNIKDDRYGATPWPEHEIACGGPLAELTATGREEGSDRIINTLEECMEAMEEMGIYWQGHPPGEYPQGGGHGVEATDDYARGCIIKWPKSLLKLDHNGKAPRDSSGQRGIWNTGDPNSTRSFPRGCGYGGDGSPNCVCAGLHTDYSIEGAINALGTDVWNNVVGTQSPNLSSTRGMWPKGYMGMNKQIEVETYDSAGSGSPAAGYPVSQHWPSHYRREGAPVDSAIQCFKKPGDDGEICNVDTMAITNEDCGDAAAATAGASSAACSGDVCNAQQGGVDHEICCTQINSCIRPSSTTGYNLTNVSPVEMIDNIINDGFDERVTGIECATGYHGDVVTSICANEGGPYELSGCEPNVCIARTTPVLGYSTLPTCETMMSGSIACSVLPSCAHGYFGNPNINDVTCEENNTELTLSGCSPQARCRSLRGELEDTTSVQQIENADLLCGDNFVYNLENDNQYCEGSTCCEDSTCGDDSADRDICCLPQAICSSIGNDLSEQNAVCGENGSGMVFNYKDQSALCEGTACFAGPDGVDHETCCAAAGTCEESRALEQIGITEITENTVTLVEEGGHDIKTGSFIRIRSSDERECVSASNKFLEVYSVDGRTITTSTSITGNARSRTDTSRTILDTDPGVNCFITDETSWGCGVVYAYNTYGNIGDEKCAGQCDPINSRTDQLTCCVVQATCSDNSPESLVERAGRGATGYSRPERVTDQECGPGYIGFRENVETDVGVLYGAPDTPCQGEMLVSGQAETNRHTCDITTSYDSLRTGGEEVGGRVGVTGSDHSTCCTPVVCPLNATMGEDAWGNRNPELCECNGPYQAATCAETATLSVPEDAEACARVTELGNAEDCGAVRTAADDNIAACTYTDAVVGTGEWWGFTCSGGACDSDTNKILLNENRVYHDNASGQPGFVVVPNEEHLTEQQRD